MSNELKSWQKLLESAKINRTKAQTQLEILTKRMQDEFGVDTVEELKKKLEEAKLDQKRLTNELETMSNEFRTKFADKLEQLAAPTR